MPEQQELHPPFERPDGEISPKAFGATVRRYVADGVEPISPTDAEVAYFSFLGTRFDRADVRQAFMAGRTSLGPEIGELRETVAVQSEAITREVLNAERSRAALADLRSQHTNLTPDDKERPTDG